MTTKSKNQALHSRDSNLGPHGHVTAVPPYGLGYPTPSTVGMAGAGNNSRVLAAHSAATAPSEHVDPECGDCGGGGIGSSHSADLPSAPPYSWYLGLGSVARAWGNWAVGVEPEGGVTSGDDGIGVGGHGGRGGGGGNTAGTGAGDGDGGVRSCHSHCGAPQRQQEHLHISRRVTDPTPRCAVDHGGGESWAHCSFHIFIYSRQQNSTQQHHSHQSPFSSPSLALPAFPQPLPKLIHSIH